MSTSTTPTETIDSKQVPLHKMPQGNMPVVGMGTFGSDNVAHEAVAESVLGAAEVGYRHFDCAEVYGNEDVIGKSFEQIIAGGVARAALRQAAGHL